MPKRIKKPNSHLFFNIKEAPSAIMRSTSTGKKPEIVATKCFEESKDIFCLQPAQIEIERSTSSLFLLTVLTVIIPSVLLIARVLCPVLGLLDAVLHLVHQQLEQLSQQGNLGPLLHLL